MSSNRRVQVLQRAVQILELVGNSRRGLRLSQIAETLCLAKQTAHKIIKTLVAEGLLVESGRPPLYALSDIMSGLRERQQAWNHVFLTRASAAAYRIYRKCVAHVMISQFTGGEVIGRLRLDPDNPDAEVVSCTGRMCPYGTGLVFQAYMSQEELRAFRRRHPLGPEQGVAGYWKSYAIVDEVIARIRKEGYVAFLRSGVLRLIVPIPRSDRRLWGTFTVLRDGAVGTNSYPVQEWIAVTRRTARELSASLTKASRKLSTPGRAGPTRAAHQPGGGRVRPVPLKLSTALSTTPCRGQNFADGGDGCGADAVGGAVVDR